MEIISCIKNRRSVRKFTDEKISHEVLMQITDAAAYSPSWKNTQTVRWNFTDSRELIDNIADNAVLGFEYNAKTLKRCSCIAVQSIVKGFSGQGALNSDGSDKSPMWEMYDAGIASQSFCLAAHNFGIGCVIMGIIDDIKLKELMNIPDGEYVAAVIAMGYPESTPVCPPKKGAEEITRFI